MKVSILSSFGFAAAVNAHAIFQRVSVNGVDQGLAVGVRALDSNYPVYNVSIPYFACNSALDLLQPVSSTVISIPTGATVGTGWGHIIGGPQIPNDPDNPIASSHHGPIQVYLAKVSNATTSGTAGLEWFKISSDGLTGGKWGVDNMIANGGWSYFTMPTCIAPGQYLMRAEILALHLAYEVGGAQFYMECAQIQVTGTGSGNYLPNSTVSFPGAYPADDPGIIINIYDASGNGNNAGKPYFPPGPPVISCASSPDPTTTTTPATQVTTTTVATTTATNRTTTSLTTTGAITTATKLVTTTKATSLTTNAITTTVTAKIAIQTHYGQCGGQGYTGPTTCASPYVCKISNNYYSQCL